MGEEAKLTRNTMPRESRGFSQPQNDRERPLPYPAADAPRALSPCKPRVPHSNHIPGMLIVAILTSPVKHRIDELDVVVLSST